MAKKKKKAQQDRPTLPLSFVTLVPQAQAHQLRCIRREWDHKDSHQWNWTAPYFYQNVLARIGIRMLSDVPRLSAVGETVARNTSTMRVRCSGLWRDAEGRTLATYIEQNLALEAFQLRLEESLTRAGFLALPGSSNPFEIVVAERFDSCEDSSVDPAPRHSTMDWGQWTIAKLSLVEARAGYGPCAFTVLGSWDLSRAWM